MPKSPKLRLRRSNFNDEILKLFLNRQKAPTNLTQAQQNALTWLLDHPEIMVLNTDKNLGPAVIKRDRYMSLAY